MTSLDSVELNSKVLSQALQCVRPSQPTILPVTAENLQRLETTGSKMERMAEEGEGVMMHVGSNGESVVMGRMEGGAGIDLSLPITSTYLRRMRGLSCEPKVKTFSSVVFHSLNAASHT